MRLRTTLEQLALLVLPLLMAHSLCAKEPEIGSHLPANPFVVVIDAGHGGKDTGAIGPSGKYEKDVVLSTARKLAGMIHREPTLRDVMVRKGDQFIDLKQRASIARKARADLFISLHADAYQTDNVEGSSVFTLSANGASSEAARYLADRENSAEIDGVKLKNHNKVLASVLVDLSKNANQEASDTAASFIMDALSKEFPVHNREIQKAGFMVLKSLDVPSILVETAFITNPQEEIKLCDDRHQDKLARALFRGIRNYALKSRPDLMRWANTKSKTP